MTTIRPFDMGINDTTINKVPIQSISWSKFKGKIPQNPPYSAHIYWNIDYRYFFDVHGTFKPTVIARPTISAKSWAREELLNDRLLRHQYGHYLIGCLCALKFQERVNNQTQITFGNRAEAIKFCQTKFQQTLKQYLQIEKKYDEETAHYYNEQQQQKWEKWITNQINSMEKPILLEKNIERNKSARSVDQKTAQSSIQRAQSSKQSRRQTSFGKCKRNSSGQNCRWVFPPRFSGTICPQQKIMKYPPLPQSQRIISYNSN